MKRRIGPIALLLVCAMIFSSCVLSDPAWDPTIRNEQPQNGGATVKDPTDKQDPPVLPPQGDANATIPAAAGEALVPSELPAFSGSAYLTIRDGVPTFREDELSLVSYEFYSPLDRLGRCGYTVASVGQDIMPTEKRGDISKVRPSGWKQATYDIISGKYLYNRCHLIGFQLTGENANERNLITGTRYLNLAMIPYENMVADYVKETDGHVMYRVEPIFEGNDLLASGVHMEAWSVEDGGEGICFNVYLYNVQPGIRIDYATGDSRLEDPATALLFPIGARLYIWIVGQRKRAV